jgi:hypothetical protein
MPIAATKQPRNKPETPFGQPTRQVPLCGIPTRERCQSVVVDAEREAGVKLIVGYREQESIAALNDIEGRQIWLDRENRVRSVSGVELESWRRQMTACDHSKFLEAQDKLQELRNQAFELTEAIFKRLIKSLDAQLLATALAGEQRLEEAELPIRSGNSWTLHEDAVCKAFWSQRHVVERTLGELSPDSAVGCVQWMCSDEEGTPYSFSV